MPSDLACFACGASPDASRPGDDCPSCGAPLMKPSAVKALNLSEPDPPILPRTQPLPREVEEAAKDPENLIDSFILLEELGEGGAGVVHRAWDRAQARFVALKILKIPTREMEARSVREAHATNRLSHPNIVKVFKTGTAGRTPFIAMELIQGRTLADLLVADPPPPLRDRIALLRTVCDAVGHAHSRGIVHRDLKPQNILVDTEGHPYVADFGLARPTEEGWTVTMSHAAIGTPQYMSPEQIRGGPASARPSTDIYSLGAILYRLLTDRNAFEGTQPIEIMHQVASAPPPDPRSLRGDLPQDLAVICLKCLEKDPDRRYASVRELADDLGRWLDGAPILARPVPPAEKAWRWLSRHRALAGAAVFAAVLLSAGAFLVAGARRRDEAYRLLENARPVVDRAQRYLYEPEADHAGLVRILDEGRRMIAIAIDRDPRLAPAQHLLGRTWELEGESEKAEEALRRAIALDPELAAAQLDLGRVLLLRSYRADTNDSGRAMTGPIREAADAIERAIAGGSSLEGDLQRRLAAAMLAFARRDSTALQKVCREAIAAHPGAYGVEEFHWLLATARDGTEGLPDLEAALARRPRYPAALYSRGVARRKAGDLPGAIADYSAFLAIRPGRPEVLNNRGYAHYLNQELDAARRDLDEALRLNPRYADALVNRGLVRDAAGDGAGAVADFDAAIAADPGLASAYNNRGALRSRRNDLDGAIADLDRALSIDPAYANAYYNRAQVRNRRGDKAGSLADFREVVRLAPADSPIHQRAAKRLREAGE